MTSISIDIDDYLSNDEILELAHDRKLLHHALDPQAITNTQFWESLADEIRATALCGDYRHLDVLPLRMTTAAAPPVSARSSPQLHA